MVTLEDSSATAGDSAITLFWVYIALAILLKGVMGMMWGLFQALQLIVCFSLWYIKVPQNVVVIQAGFKSIIGLAMIDKQSIYDKTIGKIVPDENTEESSEAAESASG